MDGKLYYTIGEVAEIMQTSTSQLRYWSGEFHLNVRKNRKGDRLFQKEDLDKLKMIQRMLKDEGFTIEGAKKKLKQGKKEELINDNQDDKSAHQESHPSILSPERSMELIQKLILVRNGLADLKAKV
jgi:DNA-binding transcriptional MerR regulator